MNRLFLACGSWLLFAGFLMAIGNGIMDAWQSPRDCTIRISVEAGTDLAVTIPCVKRNDIVEITSAFFGRGEEAQAEKFRKLLATAKHVTLTMTTKDGE